MSTPEDDLRQIQALLGDRVVGEPLRGDRFNPAAAPKPKPPAPAGKGIQPLFPVIHPKDAGKYKEEPQRAEEAFAGDRSGRFDPELNEFALHEQAKEAGVSVEEYLKSQPSRRLDKKLESTVQPQNSSERAATPDEIRIQELEAKLAALEKPKKAKKKAPEPVPPKAPEPPAPSRSFVAPSNSNAVHNPVLQRLRQRLSVERVEPAIVTIEDITFELLPPSSGLFPWMINELQEAQAWGPDTVNLTIRRVHAAACVMKIEGVATAEALGLVEIGSIKNPYFPDSDIHQAQAQALYEMFQGKPTMDHLFHFDPQLAIKIFQAYESKFKNLELKSSLDPKLRTFRCAIDGCPEQYDLAVEAGTPVFCQVHGVPAEDKGLSSEVKGLPLP